MPFSALCFGHFKSRAEISLRHVHRCVTHTQGLALETTADLVSSLVIWWHLIIDEPYQRYAHLSRVVTSQNIANEMTLDLHRDLHYVRQTDNNQRERERE
jgi:hypothetical protein